MTRRLSLFLKIIIPVLLVSMGILSISLGALNLYRSLRWADSPLDQGAAVQGKTERREGGPNPQTIKAQDQEDFLPLLLPSEEGDSTHAPDLELLQRQKEKLQAIKSSRQTRESENYTVEVQPNVQSKPKRLEIDALEIEAPVVPVSYQKTEYQGKTYKQWTAPKERAAGWHKNSALLGQAGNTVINGHSSGYNEIFRSLNELENGDLIHVYADNYRFDYAVATSRTFEERWEPMEKRLKNARWIKPSQDERLTLVSCWPYDSNTHRVVVVAIPVGVEQVSG